MRAPKVIVRVTVILVAVAGIAGHLAYLDALWWHSLGLTETMVRDVSDATVLLLGAHAVVSAACSSLAILLVLHERQRDEAARALAIAFASWSYLMSYSGVTMLFRPAAPGSLREIFEAHFLVVEVLGLAAIIRFTALFPRPLSAEELRPLETLPRVLLPFHRAAVLMRRPYAPWTAGVAVLLLSWTWATASGGTIGDAGLSHLMDVVRFCAAGVVVMNLRRAWGAATEGDRDVLAWLLTGLAFLLGSLAVLIGGNVLVAVTGYPEPHVAWRPILLDIGLVGFLVLLSRSILNRGRTDPMHLTYLVTSTAVVVTIGLFLAAGLEALFSGGVLVAYSLRGGVGTAVSFAVMLSTYRSIARFVEHLLPT